VDGDLIRNAATRHARGPLKDSLSEDRQIISGVSTSAEIEAAVDALPAQQQEALFHHFAQRLKKPSESTRRLPLVPATGRPIRQEEIDDALEAD